MIDPQLIRGAIDELVAVPSASGSEEAIAPVFARLCESAGMRTTLQPVPGRGWNVLARLSRGHGPSLLLNGHLDTLPVPTEGWTAHPYRGTLKGEWYRGAEVNNMKAALAAMVGACAALSERTDWSGGITLLGSAAECDTIGLGTVTALESGLTADAAINGEPTDLNVLLYHAGVVQVRIETSGRLAHVSQRAQGHNAITDLCRLIDQLDESVLSFTPDARYPGLPALNVGTVGGGGLPSMLADRAWASVDVRTLPGMSRETILADLQRFVSQRVDSRFPARVTALDRPVFMSPPAFTSDPSAAAVMAVAAAHREVTGADPVVGPLEPQVFFGSDASHLGAAGIATCVYGPGRAEDINTPDERIRWPDVLLAAQVYAQAATTLLTATPDRNAREA